MRRRFPPPWTLGEHNNACFIVKDATGQALGYFYFEEEFGRRSVDVRFEATASHRLRFERDGLVANDPKETYAQLPAPIQPSPFTADLEQGRWIVDN